MEVFATDENGRTDILRLYNNSREDLRKKVDKLKKWVKTHPEFPTETQDDDFLETMLMRSKYVDEKARKRIELYFDGILEYPQIFSNSRILKPSKEVAYIIPVPTLTQKFERIAIARLSPIMPSPDDFDMDRFVITAVKSGLVMFVFDYVPYLRVIMDFRGATMKHLLKVTPSALSRLIRIYEKVLKVRISGIEILNAPNILSKVLLLAKGFLKPKLFARITVHENLESLYKNVPKEYLPSDYGGTLDNCEHWLKILDKIVENHKPFLKQIEQYVENQDVKITNPFGIQGSFKSLALD